MKDKIKLALAQISSKRENKEANLQKIETLTFKAKEQGADLAIFPEMFINWLRSSGTNSMSWLKQSLDQQLRRWRRWQRRQGCTLFLGCLN